MTATVIAVSISRDHPGDPGVEREYRWEVATLAEGRRNLKGLARRGTVARLVRADGRVEVQS